MINIAINNKTIININKERKANGVLSLIFTTLPLIKSPNWTLRFIKEKVIPNTNKINIKLGTNFISTPITKLKNRNYINVFKGNRPILIAVLGDYKMSLVYFLVFRCEKYEKQNR